MARPGDQARGDFALTGSDGSQLPGMLDNRAMVALHPTLAADTAPVADWPICRVLLARDGNYPWLILVPWREDLRALHDVAADDQPALMAEITAAAHALDKIYAPDRINVAALGNIVPQLHIHVVARFADDPAWPGPVWGAAPAAAYTPAALAETVAGLQRALGAS
jgi:diadenosine tetraphosphate (Ap4A) HIT family hydrolase